MIPAGKVHPSATSASIAGSANELVLQQQSKRDVCMMITLIYSKLTRQVLCLEAGKDFVDVLLSFLTLPMGCIVKLLSGPSQESTSVGLAPPSPQTVGKNLHGKACTGIASIHQSVVKMEDSLLRVDKGLLLDALPQVPPVCFKLLRFSSQKDARKEVNYYCCGVSCNFLTRRCGFKCPRHKRRMTVLCQVLESERQNPEGQADSGGTKAFGGYVKTGAQFVITDKLEIYPSSSVKGLANLKLLRSERISDLEDMEITVGSEEILQLLKASMSCSNVLTKVFGKHLKRPEKSVTAPFPPYVTLVSTNKQASRSCPTSARFPKRPTPGRQ